MTGKTHSAEARVQMSKSAILRGRNSPLTEIRKGQHLSPATELQKGHHLGKGRTFSKEHKAKLRAAKLGIPGHPAWNKDLIGPNKGRVWSPEVRARMAEAARNRTKHGMSGRTHSEETKTKIREAKRRVFTPD